MIIFSNIITLTEFIYKKILNNIIGIIPIKWRYYWNNLSAYNRAFIFANRIKSLPVYNKLDFHPLAGKIIKNRQYFFDGSVTVYPHTDDEFIHQLFELTKGAPEPEEIFLFLQILRKLPNNAVIMELGSGQGYFSIISAKQLAKAKLFLVEANPHFVSISKVNMRLNRLISRSKVIHAAVTNRNNQYVYLQESGYGSSIKDKGEYKVSTITVDKLIEKLNLSKVDLIHMDVQGAEVNILKGMMKSLDRKCVNYIFIATHKSFRHNLCLNYLTNFEYKILYSRDPSKSTSFDGILIATKSITHPILTL